MTKIQAHRGASLERPENTLSAFKRAAELGADGIELDVRMLHDGSLVVHHDDVLGRCEAVEGSIYSYTKDNIKSFGVGGWFSKEFDKETVPFLRDVLDFLKTNNLFLNLEIKPENNFISSIGDKIVHILGEYNMVDRCIISSFNHYLLKEIKNSHPKYKVGALYDSFHSYDVTEYCLKNKFSAIHPSLKDVDEKTVELCHKNNILVNVWTVDLPKDIKTMVEYGVDTIITNDVLTAKKVLKGNI